MKSVFGTLKRLRAAALCLPIFLGLAVAVAWAAQTPISSTKPVGPYVSGQPSAGTLNVTFTACDTSNGNSFVMTGREILLVENTGMSAYTFTVSSVADNLGRTNDVTTYSLAAGDFAAFNFRGGTNGWQQGDGTVHLACSNAAISFLPLTTSN